MLDRPRFLVALVGACAAIPVGAEPPQGLASAPLADTLCALQSSASRAAADVPGPAESEDAQYATEHESAQAFARTRSSAEPFPHTLLDKLRPTSEPTSRFYVYPEIDWLSMACDGVPIERVLANTSYTNKFPKHSDDYLFIKRALEHPLRTDDPEKAELFLVPSLFNVITQQLTKLHKTPYRSCCVKGICNAALYHQVEVMLSKSQWYNRSAGRDHVLVNSHWDHERSVDGYFKRINNCNSISFEENSMRGGRCRVASTYVGRPCKSAKRKGFAFSMVASMVHEHDFPDRVRTCELLSRAEGKDPQRFSVSICGTGEQCPALAFSKFGFHAKGDTWGSNRVMDTILSRSVPAFTAEEQYDVLPPFVPWRDLSVLVHIENEERFMEDLDTAMGQYEEKIASVQKWIPLIDWERSGGAFDRYMSFFEQCIKSELHWDP